MAKTKVPAKDADGEAGSASTPTSSLWAIKQSHSGMDRGTKISERVASAIVEDIVGAGLKPGDRLPNESSMIDRFQVGRGSVREALRILEVHGLISLRSGPRGGPVILSVEPSSVSRVYSLYLHLSGSTIGELLSTRVMLEPLVARLAANQIGEADNAARLREAMEREQSGSTEPHRYISAANQFHYVVASVTGNRVFDIVATMLKELYTTRLIEGGLASLTTGPEIRFEHEEIGDAILAGDEDLAETLMRRHMEVIRKRLDAVDPSFCNAVIKWS